MTLTRPTASRLANVGAEAIEQGFQAWRSGFIELTRRAKRHFECRDWKGGQADAAARLQLYGEEVGRVVAGIAQLLDDRIDDRLVWAGLKAVYSGRIGEWADWQLAETFFNSVTRRIFSTVGVDPDVEFVDTDFDSPPPVAQQRVHRLYPVANDLEYVIQRVLLDLGFVTPFRDSSGEAAAAAARLRREMPGADRLEILDGVFFRRKGAYVIGRIRNGQRVVPLALALLNLPEGIVIDAVLTGEDDISVLFSFTRSHFHLDLWPAHSVVAFLRTLMPRKRVAELYISTGHHKHGKTELYRDLIHHVDSSTGQFDRAPGTPGLVMVVIALPGHDLVFKVIRDRFPPQKRLTRPEVRERYRLVFRHDRAGRLVEAQEFEHLQLPLDRFQPSLLEELLTEAGRSVRIDGERLILQHVYVERRVTPLDLYLRKAEKAQAEAAVLDYGQAIKDLASTDIFPGDVLLKNFGVTRHGRVVFYDYDELELLSAINFRQLPSPPGLEEEMADEPWFGVGPHDVFPAEFSTFLGLSDSLLQVFVDHHGDLFDTGYWLKIQARVVNGELVDISPYPAGRRLLRESAPVMGVAEEDRRDH